MSFLSRLTKTAPESESDRIIRNLNRVFNSRKGYGSVVEGFGLGDYEDASNTPKLLGTLMDEIVAAVRRYEPGLEAPSVELAGKDPKLWVRFVLSGLVGGVPQAFYIDMDSKYRNVVVSRPKRKPWTSAG